MGLRVKELRERAYCLFEKRNDLLTMWNLKFAFLKMCPAKVNLGRDNHPVTIKKLNGRWILGILSCNCRSWIFNRSSNRTYKHTVSIENLMIKEEKRWAYGRHS